MHLVLAAEECICLVCTIPAFYMVCLFQVIGDLVDGDGSIIQINDKKLSSTLRLKLRFTDTQMLDANGTS